MKFILILLLALLTTATFSTRLLSNHEKHKQMQERNRRCMEKHNLSHDDLQNWRRGICPFTEEGKCFLSCVFEDAEMIVDGKFSVTNARAQAEEWFGSDPEKLKVAEYMLEKCEKETADAVGCDVGLKTCRCLMGKTTDVS